MEKAFERTNDKSRYEPVADTGAKKYVNELFFIYFSKSGILIA
jgi:hypothetical protein